MRVLALGLVFVGMAVAWAKELVDCVNTFIGTDVRGKVAGGPTAGRLPCYDEAAFPPETRSAETRRIASALQAAKARAFETDASAEVTRRRDWGTNPKDSLVVFFDPEKGRYLANRRVREGDEPGRMTTRLDRPVSSAVGGKVMIAPCFRGIGTIVSGCSWKDGRWTGVVIQTPNALVENCRFDNLWQEDCAIIQSI